MTRTGFSNFVAMILTCMGGHSFSQQVSLSPSSLVFGGQPVFAASPAQTVTLTNTGTASLTISSITSTPYYTASSDCTHVSPGDSCTIDVSFGPKALGSINGAITILDNAPSSPQVVSLSGSAVAPLQISPTTVNFGTVSVGASSPPKTIMIKNRQGSGVNIEQVAITGNYSQTNNCPQTLAPGQSCAAQVIFTPTASAQVSGALSVAASVGTIPLALAVSLTGSGTGGVASQVSLQPSSLNFGKKGPFDPVDRSRTVILTNTSTSTSVTIQSVSVVGSPVSGFPIYRISSSTCAGLVAPGEKCQFTVAFSTTNTLLFPQDYPGAVTITDSDPTSPQLVGLSGVETSELTSRLVSLKFGPQLLGTTSQPQVVTFTSNDDESGLILRAITSSGDFLAVGTGSNPCGLKTGFSRGSKCTLAVSFSPHQTGMIRGVIEVDPYPQCNPDPRVTCTSPVLLNLQGTGQ